MHSVSEDEAVRSIFAESAANRGGVVLTLNLSLLRLGRLIPEYRELADRAELRLIDGMPLVWATRLRGTPVPGRVAGSDLIFSVSEAAAKQDVGIFLLGGNPGIADGASRALQARYPGLRVVGTDCPSFGFEENLKEVARLEGVLEEARPKIVFVAVGSPRSEFLMDHLRRALPQTWFIPVGISLSYVVGEVKQAPHWMRRTGLEWLFRFLQEPRRLGSRYFRECMPLAIRVLTRGLIRLP